MQFVEVGSFYSGFFNSTSKKTESAGSMTGKKSNTTDCDDSFIYETIICRLCFHFQAEKCGDFFNVTKCGHAYHASCLQEYMDRGKLICPTCSRNIHPKKLTKLYGVDPNPSTEAHSSRDTSVYASIHDYSFKIVLLGQSGVGKSCILKRFYDNSFSTCISYTGGTDLVRKTVRIGDQIIQLIIWDTLGQDRFKSVISTCVREAHGIIFVYDVTKLDTLNAIEFWWKFAEDYAPKDAVKVLVGNQVDLTSERTVAETEGQMLATNLGMPFFLTSAKEATNVEATFRTLTGKILENEWIMSAIKDKMNDSRLKLHHKFVEDEDADSSSDNDQFGCFRSLRRNWDYFTSKIRSTFQ